MNYEKLYEEAEMVARSQHANKMYDIFPYIKHIMDVVNVLKNNGYSGDDILAGFLHDCIEDGDLTYNKILKAFGFVVAEMVLVCTDPSDVRSRKEKKGRLLEKMKVYPRALPPKLADRIANMEHSMRMGNLDKVKMYVKEYPEFRNELITLSNKHASLWNRLDELTEEAKTLLTFKTAVTA